MTQPEEPDPEAMVRVLSKHHVEYVVVGALAGILQGVPLPRSLDVDIIPAGDAQNKTRLARALKEMDARLRLPPPELELPIALDDRTFRDVMNMTFITKYGPLDVLFVPAGTSGYTDLAPRAATRDVGGSPVQAIAIDDLIRCKRAAGREKDATHVLILEAHLREGRS